MTREAASRDLLAAIFAGDTRRVARLDAIYQSTAGGVNAADLSQQSAAMTPATGERPLRRQPDPT